MKRGEVYYVDFGDGPNGEQYGKRPAVIVSNDKGNAGASSIIVVPLTTALKAMHLPVHVLVPKYSTPHIREDSCALCEQVRAITKDRLLTHAGQLSDFKMKQVSAALRIAMELDFVL